MLRSSQDAAAKDFKTAPMVTDYLTRGLKSNFTMPSAKSGDKLCSCHACYSWALHSKPSETALACPATPSHRDSPGAIN